MPKSKRTLTSKKVDKARLRGRGGGRAGGAGYDLQDLFVAYQFSKMLMGDINPVVEVMWEKKAIDIGGAKVIENLRIDDVIVRHNNGQWVFSQVKEAAPNGTWSIQGLIKSRIISDFWQHWASVPPNGRESMILQLASCGNLSRFSRLLDAASRARTVAELTSTESSTEVAHDISVLAKALSVAEDDPALLKFLKTVHAEQLPSPDELYGWIIRSLFPFGNAAPTFADHLIRIVASSKHEGTSARSSHSRESLIRKLLDEGTDRNVLVAAGLVNSRAELEATVWSGYRSEVLRSFRQIRVYGLDARTPVFADLASLFVPLRLRLLSNEVDGDVEEEQPRRQSFMEALEKTFSRSVHDTVDADNTLALSNVMSDQRRFVVVGNQGSGKTTLLRWLAVVTASESSKGGVVRQRLGLSTEPMYPVYIRFRRLAERIEKLKLHGIQGRVGLISSYIQAEFQGGVGKTLMSEAQALRMASELLESENSIFLFDALDEVTDDSIRGQLQQAVADLIQTYMSPRVVVSSRPYALSKHDLGANLPRYGILPFNRREIESFCRNWYEAVSAQPGTDICNYLERADHLIEETKKIQDLAQSPLLLSILALVHFNKGGLPLERARLYDYATLAILGHWERDQGRKSGEVDNQLDWASHSATVESAVRPVVEQLASDIQRSETGTEVTYDAAIESIVKGIRRLLTSRNELVKLADYFLSHLLVDRIGLIEQTSKGVFRFIHLGFQEYLSARWFLNNGEVAFAELIDRSGDERYGEVVRFAAGILALDGDESTNERAVELILSVAERNSVLAAVSCLEIPQVALDTERSVELARSAWADSSRYFYHRSDILARVLWPLLSRAEHQDKLLLELLTQEDQSRRHPGGAEMAYALLGQRPGTRLSPEMEWFLRTLAVVREDHGPSIAPICELLLVESGTDEVSQHTAGLIQLLRPGRWEYGEEGHSDTIAERSSRALVGAMNDPIMKPHIIEALYHQLYNEPESSVTLGIGKLLLSQGEPLTDKLVAVLVACAVERRWDTEFHNWVGSLIGDVDNEGLIIDEVNRRLRHGSTSVREGAAKFLSTIRASSKSPDVHAMSNGDPDANSSGVLPPTRESITSESILQCEQALWEDPVERGESIWSVSVTLVEAKRMETPGLARALVRAGLASKERRSAALESLRLMLGTEGVASSTRAAILDGLEAEESAIASSAAGLLVEVEVAPSNDLTRRILRALLRDEEQIPLMIPGLRKFLSGDLSDVAVKTLSEYLKDEHGKNKILSLVSRLLAESGHFEAENLAACLALNGFTDPMVHDEIIGYLKQMLGDPRLVTDVREGLSKALESNNSSVVWGAVRCLWEAGMRFEPKLLTAIYEEGLEEANDARRREAREMLLLLIRDPMTRFSTIEVLRHRLENFVKWREKDHSKVWPIAECLMTMNVYDGVVLPEVVVRGGLHFHQDFENLAKLTQQGITENAAFSSAIEDELRKAVGDEKLGWPAVRLYVKALPDSFFRFFTENADSHIGSQVVRVLLLKRESDADALRLLNELSSRNEYAGTVRRCLIGLLTDDKVDIAFESARTLIEEDDVDHIMIPRAVVRGGFSGPGSVEGAISLLDTLRKRPGMELPIRAALFEALWGNERDQAWNSAVYLMDRWQGQVSGVARGLVFGGFEYGWRRQASVTQRRLRELLFDQGTKQATEEALVAHLFETKGQGRVNMGIAALLVLNTDIDLCEILALSVDEGLRWLAVPTTAIIALSGKWQDTLAAAQRLGAKNLASLLEGKGFPPIDA